MTPDDWLTVTGAVSASLVILGVAIEQWGKYPEKKADAEFYKNVYLQAARDREQLDRIRQENSKEKEERNAKARKGAGERFGRRDNDNSSNGVSRRKSGTKLIQQSETVFKLTEDIQDFRACSTCPDCGLTAFHFINSSDQNSKIMRECVSCKKVWLQLK